MKWGSFGVVHLATLAFAAAMILGLYFALRKAPKKVKIGVLGVLSLSGIAAIVFNLVTWGSPLEYLPLHLCSINALLLPIVVFTRNKTLGNLLLVWCLGALVVNFAQAEYELASWTFVFYYFPHVLDYAGNLIQVNYMYSIVPENPLLALFKQVIPYDYWHMYMIVPILAVYLGIVYLPQILRSRPKTASMK